MLTAHTYARTNETNFTTRKGNKGKKEKEINRRMSPMLVVDIHKRYSTHLAVDFDPLKPDFERDVNERHTHHNVVRAHLLN